MKTKTVNHGVNFEYEPENIDAISYIDFTEMPLFTDDGKLIAWVNNALAAIESETGVNLAAFYGDNCDWLEVAAVLNSHGFHTYDSDDRFEVYARDTRVIICPDCGEYAAASETGRLANFATCGECGSVTLTAPAVDSDPTPAQGIERPNAYTARVSAARQWLRDIADLIADPDTADSDALETLSRALDALDAATN